MMSKSLRCAAALLLLAILPETARAEAGSSYECRFEAGTAFSYEAGAFHAADAKPLAFTITGAGEGAASATLVLDRGTSALKVVQALGARHFLEVAVEGYLNVTTIYEAAGKDGAFAAIHSRHLAIVGVPFVAQYRGACRSAP